MRRMSRESWAATDERGLRRTVTVFSKSTSHLSLRIWSGRTGAWDGKRCDRDPVHEASIGTTVTWTEHVAPGRWHRRFS